MSSNGFNPSYNNKFLLIQFDNPVSEQIKFPKFPNFFQKVSNHKENSQIQIFSVGICFSKMEFFEKFKLLSWLM